jgi:hypothetical protein
MAQDYIYKRDGNRIAAKNIVEMTDYINYQNYNNLDKQVLSINNEDVSFIAYENGTVNFIEKEARSILRYDFNKNIINYHLFDLVVNNFKISYERLFVKGKIGIQIPIAFGYGNTDQISGFDDVRNRFYSGISLNFYPTGQGKVRYFMGPGIQMGAGYFDNGYWSENSYGNVKKEADFFIFRFLINNGIAFTPIKELSVSMVGSLGIRYTDKSENSNSRKTKTVGAFSTNLSYRF